MVRLILFWKIPSCKCSGRYFCVQKEGKTKYGRVLQSFRSVITCILSLKSQKEEKAFMVQNFVVKAKMKPYYINREAYIKSRLSLKRDYEKR